LANGNLETYPTIDSIYNKLKDDPSLPKMGMSTCRNILLRIGFRFSHVWSNDHALLLENNHVVNSRRNYIKQIRKFRLQGRKIFYLDETYVNQGYAPVSALYCLES
jgi:hypothetical protein